METSNVLQMKEGSPGDVVDVVVKLQLTMKNDPKILDMRGLGLDSGCYGSSFKDL